MWFIVPLQRGCMLYCCTHCYTICCWKVFIVILLCFHVWLWIVSALCQSLFNCLCLQHVFIRLQHVRLCISLTKLQSFGTYRRRLFVTYALSEAPSMGGEVIIRASSDAVFGWRMGEGRGEQLWRWHQLLLTPAQHHLFFPLSLCRIEVYLCVLLSLSQN